MKVLIATRNKGKSKEIQELLRDFPATFYSPDDLGITEDCEETATTFEGNALLKAKFYAQSLPEKDFLVIADDSGIHVNALADELGVQTRRWGAGAQASDEEWLGFFLKRMEREADRRARFVCAIALLDGEAEQVFLGENEGDLQLEPQTDLEPGIPLSSIFQPLGFDRVYSALSVDEKNQISHRGRALQKLLNHLLNGS